ncbi:histidine phosphatase family protein [Candidatus Campbellbacteria bacterium]|nr:MAG: histidine phosphatase family protein [Candidatus Campbellbacteria bacterium]
MKIFVVRHGQTESNQRGFVMGNRIDEPLNNEGIHQAEKIATELGKEKFDIIFFLHSQKGLGDCRDSKETHRCPHNN